MIAGFVRPAAAAFVAGLAVTVVSVASGAGGYLETPGSRSVAPAPVASSPVTVEPPPTVVPDDSGIPGVVAWETRGWPASTGPAVPGALPHNHADGPIRYPVTPPARPHRSATIVRTSARRAKEERTSSWSSAR